MRARTNEQAPIFLMINVEAELPESHPLRAIKRRTNGILVAMSREFDAG